MPDKKPVGQMSYDELITHANNCRTQAEVDVVNEELEVRQANVRYELQEWGGGSRAFGYRV